MKKLIVNSIVISTLILLGVYNNSAQTIDILSVDYSAFPVAKANFHLKGKDGNMIRSFSTSDFKIKEEGIQRAIKSIECDDTLKNISLILAIDVSTSMGDNIGPNSTGIKKINAVRSALNNMIDSLPDDNFECCVLAFNQMSQLRHKFSNNKQSIKDSINNTIYGGRSDWNAAFLAHTINRGNGAIEMARLAKYQPIIVFITDGPHDAPDVPPGWAIFKRNEILDSVEAYKTTIYSIAIGDIGASALDDLRMLSEPVKGELYNVDNESDLNNSTIEIFKEIRPGIVQVPCVLEFVTDCDGGGEIVLESAEFGISDTFFYNLPDSLKPMLVSYNNLLSFMNVPIGETDTLEFRIKALNKEIRGIKFSAIDPLFTIISIEPDSLSPEEEAIIRVAYTPDDSLCHESELTIESNACNKLTFELNAGYLYSADVAFDSTYVDSTEYKLVEKAICNMTCDTVRINETTITYDGKIEFMITDFNGIAIPPGECVELTYQFTPSKEGIRKAEIMFRAGDIYLYSKLTGIGKGLPSDVADVGNEYNIRVSPNPFSESLCINFRMPFAGRVKIDVYDATGNIIANLLDDALEAGNQQAYFNSDGLAQGMYFYQIRINDIIKTGQLLLIR